MKRLNGWQRIGVVLSVLWSLFVVGLAYEYMKRGLIDPYDLLLLDHLTIFLGHPPRFVVVLAALAFPIVGGWLLVYGIVWATKWVTRGFKSEKKSI